MKDLRRDIVMPFETFRPYSMIKRNIRLKQNRTLICLLITVTYFLINLILLQHHEMWRDESQAWVLVKNNGFVDIFELLSSEGHPPMWFLCIYPFVKGGFSFWNFGWISLVIMTATVFALLYYSEQSVFFTLVIICSSAFMYFNAVICRVYSLVVLFVLLLSIIWKNRQNHLFLYGFLVACIIQTHILMCGFACACIFDVLLMMGEKKQVSSKAIFCIVEVLFSLILLICFLHQSPSSETFLSVSPSSIFAKVSISSILTGLKSILNYLRIGKQAKYLMVLCSFFLVYLAYALIKHKLIRNYKGELVTLFFIFAAYISIICFVRNAQHPQMAICGLILIIFTCQILISKNDKVIVDCSKAFLVICCFFTYYSVIKDARADYLGEFSHSKQISSYILDNIEPKDTIMLINNNMMTSVYAYVSDKMVAPIFIDLDTREPFQFHKWGKESKLNSEEKILAQIQIFRQCKKEGNCYYLSSVPLSTKDNLHLVESFSGNAIWEDESYYLYKYG